ncbi:MAG TPA: pilus (MSHA type) biogenesis protein MshL, partial [Gammaproteobacteria bacterium]|nr:pilus (MSHA type) biogenesis protein MshL [Gammaproteobacteria bacterium]
PPLEAAPPPADPAEQQQRFDVRARDVSVREVLLGLVEDTRYSVVIDPQVEGAITLNLRQVTVAEAMRFLSRAYGYGVERIGQRFLVSPAAVQTRTFQVDYLNVSRSGSSQTQVSSGEVTQNVSGGDSGGGSGGSETVGSEVQTKSQADFWKQLRSGLEAILADDGSGQGKLVMHPESSVVLVRAMPDTLHDVSDYLEAVQGGSHRQVIIEAKVLEVQLSDSQQTGINWASLGSAGEAQVATKMTAPNSGGLTAGEALTEGPAFPGLLPQLQGVEPGGVFSAAVATEEFSAMLNLLETQGDVNVLSSPRVATVNNQKAVIKVGVDEFFLTDVELQNSNTAGTATQQQNFDVDLTPFFDGIALDVTPQISQDGMVTLHVHPSVTDVSSQQKRFQFSNNQDFSFPLARSDVRESDSIVRARDGEIVVIGGLMKESTSETQSRVPLLGSIPLLGALFRHQSTETVKRELVILLRPRVVPAEGGGGGREQSLERAWNDGLSIQPSGR